MAQGEGKVRMRPIDEEYRRAVCPFDGNILMESVPADMPTTSRIKCSVCHRLLRIVIQNDGVSVSCYKVTADI